MKHKHFTKVVSSLIILTALIIGLSIFAQWLLNRDALKLGQPIDEIVRNTQAKDWDKAKANLAQVNSTWLNVKGLWSALIDHQEIDNIDDTLSRLQMLVQAEEVPSSMAEAAALKKYIEHIPSKERLSLENIF